MPRVVQNQQSHFKNDDFFKKISRESEVRYTAHKELRHEERVKLFYQECKNGDALDVAILSTGTSIKLTTEDLQAAVGATKTSNSVQPDSSEGGYYDLGREPNKVWIQSPMILNGVCVKWRGYIDINQLEGCGKFDYDEARGSVEAEALRLSMGKSMRKMSEGALEA